MLIFLFRRKDGADGGRLGCIWEIEADFFCRDRRVHRRTWCSLLSRDLQGFLRELGRICLEPFLSRQVVLCEGRLDCFLLALRRSLEIRPKGQDSAWGRHLEDKVWVMWDGHEFSQPRTPNDGVVDGIEGRHLKAKSFCAKVLRCAKGDW